MHLVLEQEEMAKCLEKYLNYDSKIDVSIIIDIGYQNRCNLIDLMISSKTYI